MRFVHHCTCLRKPKQQQRNSRVRKCFILNSIWLCVRILVSFACLHFHWKFVQCVCVCLSNYMEFAYFAWSSSAIHCNHKWKWNYMCSNAFCVCVWLLALLWTWASVPQISRRSRMEIRARAHSRSRICILTHHWINRLKRIFDWTINNTSNWSAIFTGWLFAYVDLSTCSSMHIANTQVN